MESKSLKKKHITLKEYLLNLKDLLLYMAPIYTSIFVVLLFKIPFYLSLTLGIIVCILIDIMTYRGILKNLEEVTATSEDANNRSNLLKT